MENAKIKQILVEYENRDNEIYKTNFWRDAASSNLDYAKFSALEALNAGQATQKSKYLIKYEFRSLEDYSTQLALSNDSGLSQLIIETYCNHFSKINYSVKIKNLPLEIQKKLEDDYSKEYNNKFIEEILTVGRVFEIVDKDENDNFYCYLLPIEAVRNYSGSDNNFNFFVWDGIESQTNGFSEIKTPVIYARNQSEFVTIAKLQKDWQIVNEIENKTGSCLVSKMQLGEKGLPIINSSSKWQHDLYNLQSEWRLIIRDQGGLNFLTAPEGSKIEVMTNNTIIFYPIGQNPPSWAAYPSSGLDAHKNYWETAIKLLENLSKIRKQSGNESGLAKSYDFVNTEAVLVALSLQLEKLIKERVKNIGLLYGEKNTTAEITFDKASFKVDDLNQQIEQILQLQAVSMPDFYKDEIIKRFIVSEFGKNQNEVDKNFADWRNKNNASILDIESFIKKGENIENDRATNSE